VRVRAGRDGGAARGRDLVAVADERVEVDRRAKQQVEHAARQAQLLPQLGGRVSGLDYPVAAQRAEAAERGTQRQPDVRFGRRQLEQQLDARPRAAHVVDDEAEDALVRGIDLRRRARREPGELEPAEPERRGELVHRQRLAQRRGACP
jgi:hypothetical protein